MKISTIGIVGCGLMGSGIAQLALQANYTTLIYDTQEHVVLSASERIRQTFLQKVDQGRQKLEDVEKVLAKLQLASDLDAFARCDVVVEAIVEKMEEKQKLFKKLDELCPPTTILASNTSALSLTEISLATKRRELVGGFHFHNPATRMRLVEVVKGLFTSSETIEVLVELGKSLGKEVEIVKDTPGFIVNRLIIPYILDGISLLEQGLAERDTIDNCMHLGCNQPMGPLLLADFMGLDTVYYTALTLHEELKEARYSPPRLLERMVLAGSHGVKNGRGFYNYANPSDAGDRQARITLKVGALFR